MNPVPSLGRIVLYTLSNQDAQQINRRRTNGSSIADRIASDRWPAGAQAHIGNEAMEGQVFPAMVIRVWSPTMVSLKVELDGTDQLWATSIEQADTSTPGRYHWMEYQKAQVAAR